MRALETRDADRTVMSDADREWATRAAAEVEGEGAPPDRFLARRAALALERLRAKPQSRPIDRVLRAVAWRAWIGWALVAASFAFGLASNQLGPSQRVNVLAFPLLALLAWNVAMYVVLALRLAFGWLLRRRTGPLRALLVRLAQGIPGGGVRDRAGFAPASLERPRGRPPPERPEATPRGAAGSSGAGRKSPARSAHRLWLTAKTLVK